MAKVTLTFEDMEDGVSLVVASDPSLPEKISDDGAELTDAQKMAISMAVMFDAQMNETEENHDHSNSGHCTRHEHNHGDSRKKCCGSGKCHSKSEIISE